MRDEYDFSNGVRGVHAARYAAGVDVVIDGEPKTAVVTLDPDVARTFGDSKSVNEALRLLIRAAKSAESYSKAS